MEVVQVVFETHSTSEDNERGVATGWLRGKLSIAGQAQAREPGKRRCRDNIGALLVRPEPRG